MRIFGTILPYIGKVIGPINDEYVSGFICSYGFAIKQPDGPAFYPLSEIEQAYKIGA